MRDTQRAKVYAAEDFVRTLFDRAAQHGTGAIDFFGTALTLPPEARFGSVDAVRRYVDDVLALPAVRDRWPGAGKVAVRSRRGLTAAHYESTPATIAVPDRSTNWALRELVVFFGHFTAVYSTIPAENPVGGGLMTAGISLPQHRARSPRRAPEGLMEQAQCHRGGGEALADVVGDVAVADAGGGSGGRAQEASCAVAASWSVGAAIFSVVLSHAAVPFLGSSEVHTS